MQGELVIEHMLFAEKFSVIRRQDHDGVVEVSMPRERSKQLPKESVQFEHRGVVGSLHDPKILR